MNYKLIIDKTAEESVTVVAREPSSLTQAIEDLIRDRSGADGLMGHSEDGMQKLAFREIECITVLERKVIAIDAQGRHWRISDRLRDLEQVLPSYFIRINKSTLANEHRIARFDAVFNGSVDAVFRCGHRDYISRRCFAEIKRRYHP